MVDAAEVAPREGELSVDGTQNPAGGATKTNDDAAENSGTLLPSGGLTSMKKLFPPVASATYEHVTGHVTEQMSYFLVESRRHAGIDALVRRERAYGLYIGWRALAVEMTSAAQFARDDRRLEALLA